MSRFDFTGYVQQREDAARAKEKAERDRERQTRDTWVELRREAANYVQRNGRACQVTGDYPTIELDTGNGRRLVVTVKSRGTFGLAYTGQPCEGALDDGQRAEEVSGDQAVMKAIVEWYEAASKPWVA